MQRRAAAAHDFDPPVEDVADGRLARFDAEKTWQDRAVDDAADAGDGLRPAFPGWRNRAIARRRADDLHQRADFDPGSHRAVVRVESAHRDDDAFAKPERARPLAAQVAGGNPRRQRAIVEAIAQV